MRKLFLLVKGNYKRFLTSLLYFLFHFSTFGQHGVYFKKYSAADTGSFSIDKPYYIANSSDQLPLLMKVVRQLDESSAIVMVNSPAEFKLLSQTTKIAVANNRWKLSPLAERLEPIGNLDQKKIILSGFGIDELLGAIEKFKSQLNIITIDRSSNSILVRLNDKKILDNLLSLKEIIFIDVRSEPHTEIGIIGYNRSFHGLNEVDYSIPGANGNNIVTGVKEQKMDETDLDLYNRVLPSSLANANITNHSTVISSIIGGAGNSFYDGRGIAHACKFFPSNFANLFADDIAVLNANKVTVQNHSYGTIIQQFYGAEAVSYDAQTWGNKNLVHVFSAGNQGTGVASEGKYVNISGFANLTGNFKMAKNIITVGAINNDGSIPAESSSGPLYDGRLAPQLTALGPNGTSDAAAIVSGTIAVMQQVYADSNNQLIPPASLVKAVLYNTADDIYHEGIDFKTGFGLVNSASAIRSIQQKEYENGTVAQGQQWTKIISVPPNAAQMKITLAWTDTTASLNNNKGIINDLDLEVTEPGTNTVYLPWVLNVSPVADSLSKLPSRKRDSLNTAEQVSFKLPSPGNFEIKVKGTNIVSGIIPFSVAFHIDTLNTFHFTSPQHASDVNRQEHTDLDIRWKTYVADTNTTGNLLISYDNGSNWQVLRSAQKLNTNYFSWPIKDTASTAVLKMETPFGDFLSKNFIVSKPVRLNVEFLCNDSFSVSWNKHVYASSYKLYALTDSPYLKPFLSVTDTFAVLNRNQYPSLVYAVEPVLSNGLPAARSIAQNITIQGVKCFYKTFYYDLLDQNRLDLVLELSAISYVDSVYFEQVNENGQVVKVVGSAKVNSGLIYHQQANDIPSGTSYWRARIKLKSGAIVYTEITSVLTSGKNYILFYPNPVDRASGLTWILQQGIPSDSKLQLFDMSGRILKSFEEMPNSINLSSFPPGMIIYKLYSGEGKLLEVGKILLK